MADIAKIIESNLKRLRIEMKISLDKVSYLTDISKSILSGIEKGNKSPTVFLLWKLCLLSAGTMEGDSLEKGVNYRVLFHFTPKDYLEFYRQTCSPHTARSVLRRS